MRQSPGAGRKQGGAGKHSSISPFSKVDLYGREENSINATTRTRLNMDLSEGETDAAID